MSPAALKLNPTGVAVIRYPVMTEGTLASILSSNSEDLGCIVRCFLAKSSVIEALAIASPSLHGRVFQWMEGASDFSALERIVARYLMRMSFRSTPFGAFSCTTTWVSSERRLSIETEAAAIWPKLPSREEMVASISLDSKVLNDLAEAVRASCGDSLLYFPNDTLRLKGSEYIYMTKGSGRTMLATPFQAVSVERSLYLDVLIEKSTGGMTKGDMVRYIREKFPAEPLGECQQFVEDVIDQQILVSDYLHPVVTEDALLALADGGKSDGGISNLLSELEGLINPENGSVSELLDVSDRVRGVLARGIQVKESEPVLKVDLVSRLKQAAAVDPLDVSRKISGVMARIVKLRRSTQLDAFVNKFSERFGESEIPLLEVAEILEFLGFDHQAVQPPLVKLVMGMARSSSAKRARTSSSKFYSPYLVNSLLGDDLYIDVSATLPSQGEDGPTDLVAWVAAWDPCISSGPAVLDKSVFEIQKVVRSSGNRLLGRFAGSSIEVRDHLEDYSRSEEASHSVKAELVHLCHPKLGNVCSRVPLTQYQVGVRAGVRKEGSVLLADLMVRVSDGVVRLRSTKLERDIRLQMSNAHAYGNAPGMPLYRFLCCIANQDDVVELPNLRSLTPEARFVPGLKCDGIVVSRATWRLPAEFCKRLEKLSKDAGRSEIRSAAGLDRWPNPVALVVGDRVTPFNIDIDWMVDELATELKRLQGANLREVYLEGMRPALSSEEGRHFHEILVPLTTEIRNPVSPARTMCRDRSILIREPWSDWAYMKLYVSPVNQDQVLKAIAPILNVAAACGDIEQYFYVRYVDEGGDHLRLRLNRHTDAMSKAWALLAGSFADLQAQGLIHLVCTDTYLREVDRYGGPENIDYCESIFCVDSVACLEVLDLTSENGLTWDMALALVDRLITVTGLSSIEERLAFVRLVSAQFQNEFKFDPKRRKRIGSAFKLIPSSYEGIVAAAPMSSQLANCDAVIATIWLQIASSSVLTPTRLHRIRWSILHMRVNRLLSSMPRMQEAIIFDILRRVYERELATRDVAIGETELNA